MEIKGFKGLRNTTSPERFKPGDLAVAYDVNIDNTGKIASRKGLTLKNPTALHSLYSSHSITIAVAGQSLVSIGSDFSLTTLKTLTSTRPLSVDTVIDTIYYSNGVDSGRIRGSTVSSWGVTPPIGQPAASSTYGVLPAGKYQYALTFLRGDYESGTGLTGTIDLPSGGGISFSNIEVSTNPEVTDKVLYISGANGEQVYKAVVLPNAQTTYVYAAAGLDLTIPLITQFKSGPPPGYIVRTYNGRMYVVTGDAVYYSDPYSLELFDLGSGFLRFPGQVALFEPVNDGIYVATEDSGEDESAGATWFISGNSPEKMQSVQLFAYGAISRTSVRTEASFFDTPGASDPENRGSEGRPAIVWSSRHGIIMGKDGGVVQNITEAKYSFPYAAKGAAAVKQTEGFNQYIVTLQDTGALNNAYTGE